ncbi:MAG: hypothetical protein KIC98_11410 [Clostridioides difficile]|nr:hypothetical protein [Clostridioides sp.]MBS5788506.1 hypothetical protein [Clostridioides difficile]
MARIIDFLCILFVVGILCAGACFGLLYLLATFQFFDGGWSASLNVLIYPFRVIWYIISELLYGIIGIVLIL